MRYIAALVQTVWRTRCFVFDFASTFECFARMHCCAMPGLTSAMCYNQTQLGRLIPSTLTLNPQPSTLNPKPFACLNPKPSTFNNHPVSQALDPRPRTRHPILPALDLNP
eukprot:2843557-Rhodomonas_salina.4